MNFDKLLSIGTRASQELTRLSHRVASEIYRILLPSTDITQDDIQKLGIEAKQLKFLPWDQFKTHFAWPSEEEMSRNFSNLKDAFRGYPEPDFVIYEYLSAGPYVIPIKRDHHIRRFMETEVVIPETKLRNPETCFELSVSGTLDHVRLQYEESDEVWKASPQSSSNPPIGQCFDCLPDCGRVIFIQRTFPPLEEACQLRKLVPGAVARAMVVAQVQRLSELRFGITDGSIWSFLLLKKTGDKWAYYKSDEYDVGRAYVDYSSGSTSLADFKQSAFQVLFMLNAWSMYLPPEGLYELV